MISLSYSMPHALCSMLSRTSAQSVLIGTTEGQDMSRDLVGMNLGELEFDIFECSIAPEHLW
jgi:hypothetical protein